MVFISFEESAMKARDFIKPGESMMVLFTDGTLFEFGDDNTGLTGDWHINPSHSIDRVIIYVRGNQKNTVYIANHAGVEFIEENNKYKIKLAHVQYIGKTDLNWNKFADTGTKAIRYLP
jgi:hypothetical protein